MQSISESGLISHLPCGIFTFSDHGTIIFISEPLLKKLQYSLPELEGKSVESIFTLSTRIFYQTHFFPLLKLHKRVDEIFLTLLNKNKEEIPVLLNAVQEVDEGKVVNICVAITVYQRRKYEDEILLAKKAAEDAIHKNEELRKVKQELEEEREALDKQITRLRNKNQELAQISNVFTHDLQEPVRKVSLVSDLIRNDENMLNGEEAKGLFTIINRSSLKMRKLLKGIEEYLYLNNNSIKFELVELKGILQRELAAVLERHQNVRASVEVEDLAPVKGDAAQLAILFQELLENCFRFKSDRPLEIKIGCSLISENVFNSTEGKYKYGRFAQISIQDNGIGFNNETRQHIFKILKKLDIASEGLGMGLALCKKVVENHGGKITAIGEEGIGSKFVVTLPIS